MDQDEWIRWVRIELGAAGVVLAITLGAVFSLEQVPWYLTIVLPLFVVVCGEIARDTVVLERKNRGEK
jgi:uncharacterized membrane protein AbrB (regulator of aidB expression)